MKEYIPLTMKDIAQALNVSVATVSRALNNSAHISQKQKERIQAYAKAHDYAPNFIAESLRHTRVKPFKIIGVIIPEFTHYYFSTILQGIESAALARGYRIMVAQSGEQYQKEVEICQSFDELKVCGIIISQAKDTTRYEHFQKLINKHIPIIFYDRISTGVHTGRVVVDDYMGAYNAVKHLIETGCKRIAFYGADMKMEISKNRYNGYLDALHKYKIKIDPDIVKLCDTREKAELITPELLQMKNRPDAFFAVNDETAIGALYTAKRMGFKIPQEISICGFTNGQRAITCDPPLTTVEQKGKILGEEAVDLLIRQVESIVPYGTVEKRIIRTKLVIRGTTRQT